MKYILITLMFMGPTSVNEINYRGTFDTIKECFANAHYNKFESWVCIPIEVGSRQ